jgi:hypothetical protein
MGKEVSGAFFLLIGGGEREGVVGTQCNASTLSRVRLTCGMIGLKPTRATVPPGWTQIIKPNVFSIFQTDPNL